MTAELISIREERSWSRTRLGAAIGKHANTIRGWEIGDRLPDKANVALICRTLQVAPARGAFLEHVIEQLNEGPDLISDLGKRNLFIVESAERHYGEIIKWDPLQLSGLSQTEDYHMKELADPLEGPAFKIKHWLRKQRRQVDFFGRSDAPQTKFLQPVDEVMGLKRLTKTERKAQIDRLLEIDNLPNCEVFVVQRPYIATHAFEIFRPGRRPGAGPDFVFVETLDQSRHIVEPEKIALYDRFSSVMLDDASRIGRFLDG
ncbi:Scr1 family TA system antitoxin-like transcriptional regulator [Glycomyces sp. NPDC049804]|uniref:helix-turn-helix domain-containing protein n=1 Tax=Glycomyces sp. NPDC049804 TaxID=3154363 RepID=UPI003426EB36